jgi:diaminopimelate decarboxylase
MEKDDLLAIRSVGAYGAVMASTYNTRKLIPEVIVNNKEFVVVRPRPSYDEIIGLDQLPPWLSK